MERLHRFVFGIDWLLVVPAVLLTLAGMVTMNSFVGENRFFERQLVWLLVSLFAFFILSALDLQVLRRGVVVTAFYVTTVLVLIAIFIFGTVTLGAQSRFDLGAFAIQPADPAKLVLILILAKYFSRRHIEIANIRHILVSGAYAFILFALVLVQPDFGSAVILASIWFGMVLVSGISKKHLALVFGGAALAFILLWTLVFADYQKQRIMTFIDPLADLQGAGYNAYQSMIAVGSGELFGKGIGYGTQSKLQFLPEYETDFIFAAFAEEWGFIGAIAAFALFGIIVWRLLLHALYGASNFETLFSMGVATLIMAHIIVHIGMNIGLLPVTGTTVPFMSYGGSHLLTEFAALGIVSAMARHRRTVRRDDVGREFIGV